MLFVVCESARHAVLVAASRAPAHEAVALNGMVATGHALATVADVDVVVGELEELYRQAGVKAASPRYDQPIKLRAPTRLRVFDSKGHGSRSIDVSPAQ